MTKVKKHSKKWSAAEYLFTQPTVTSANVKGGKLTIDWGKIDGATNYTIYASNYQKNINNIHKTERLGSDSDLSIFF